MRIHVIQTGTVAIKQVQRQGRPSGNPILNMLLDPNWTEPMPIYAFVVGHPEGLIVVARRDCARGRTRVFPVVASVFPLCRSRMGAARGGDWPADARDWVRPYPSKEESGA